MLRAQSGNRPYARLLEVITDRAHPEHRETLTWCGGRFDPKPSTRTAPIATSKRHFLRTSASATGSDRPRQLSVNWPPISGSVLIHICLSGALEAVTAEGAPGGRRYVEQVILRTRFRSVDAFSAGATHAELLAVLCAAQAEVLKEAAARHACLLAA
jgi:hypothetical protein